MPITPYYSSSAIHYARLALQQVPLKLVSTRSSKTNDVYFSSDPHKDLSITLTDADRELWGQSPLSKPINQKIKRGIDLVFGIPAVLITLPIMGVFCTLKFLEDIFSGKGFLSPLWKGPRAGTDGRTLTIYKIRTMIINENTGKITAVNDHRITPVGKIMRRFKIDELPQLFSVLAGNLSLVGPRLRQKSNYNRNPKSKKILPFKQGLTGTHQLLLIPFSVANYPSMDAERYQMDRDYLLHWSPWQDIALIIKTPFKILGQLFSNKTIEPPKQTTDVI
ncbi:MAG: sugar transferase [Vampirovibrionales bacterium]|nr:sugar transferase [Vampirovibrionales bacterium]